MGDNKQILNIVIFSIILGVVLLGGSFILPWNSVKWGTLGVSPGETVTVVGEAQTQLKSQIAVFSAGVSSVNDNKDTAINEVNQKITKIVEAVKTFGVPEADIKTQNMSVYQSEETYYEEGRQKSRLGQWRVNNTIEVKLRDVEKSNELADLLTKNGANNVYGPNFSVDDTSKTENSLLEEAIKNAREKADIIAKSTSRRIGKVVNVTEGYQTSPVALRSAYGLGAGGGGDAQPGSQTVAKALTVTFELK